MVDVLSLVAGAVVAGVLGFLIYSQRGRLSALRSSATQGVTTARKRLGRGLDARYREVVINLANKQHLAGQSVPLERLAVMPRFYTLPKPHDPLEDETAIGYDGPLNMIPLTPAWPQAMAPYQLPGVPMNKVLRGGNSIALLGNPGSGRSTALALMAILVARQTEADQAGGLLAEKRLPMLIHLSDVDLTPSKLVEGTDPLTPLMEAAGSQIGGFVGAALGNIRNQFESGGGLILMDAWDELSMDHRLRVVEWLKVLMRAYPGNQYVVVGAPNGYKPLFDLGLTPVFIMPWSTPEYTELINLWQAAWPVIGGTVKSPAMPPDQPVLQVVQRGNRFRTPLEVTLKIWAAFAKDDPGIGQVGWYRAYINRSLPSPDLRPVLEGLGHYWIDNPEYSGFTLEELNRAVDAGRNKLAQRSVASTGDIIHAAMNQAHILAERGTGRITFTQPMIAAYLAAESQKNVGFNETLLEEFPFYDLVMPLLAQLTDMTPYVQARLAEAETLLQHNMLMLAQWAAEADPRAVWRADIFKQLTALFLGPSEFPLVREQTMSALVASRDRNISFIFRNGLQNSEPRIRILSALGLGAMGDPEQLMHVGEVLNDPDQWVETAGALALGALGTKAALNYMLQTFLQGRELARRAVGEMLATTNINGEGHDILKEAMAEPDPQARRAAVYGLQLIDKDWAMELLRTAENRDDQWVVRTAAASAIETRVKGVDTVKASRPPSPEQSNWLVMWLAERDQAIEPGPRAISQLIRALQEGDETTRIAAAEALGALGLPEAIPPLYAALRDQHHLVRDAAYRALGRISLTLGHSLPAVA